MASTLGRLVVLGGNPVHGSDTLDSRMGACLWDLSLGQRTGDGRFDGEAFSGGLLIFFLGGRGRGRGTPGHDCRGVFRRTTRVPNSPIFYVYILYIVQWKFRCSMHQTVRKVPSILDALGSARVLFKVRQPVDLVPH
jgi:hypothetical protein